MQSEKDLSALGRIHDRILATSETDITGVLNTLLHKLLPMAGIAFLETKVAAIVETIVARLAVSKCTLKLDNLLSVVHSSQPPKVVELAIAVLNALLTHCVSNKMFYESGACVDCGEVLVRSLESFAPFTAASNALCYYSLYVLADVATILTATNAAFTPAAASAGGSLWQWWQWW